MKPSILLISAILATPAMAEPQEARQHIKGFATELKQTLVSTMKAKGPLAAIETCHISAPVIADQHSQSPWHISRSSLKVRNPDNAPNEWLIGIMNDFEKRKAQGEPVGKIEHAEQKEDGWYFVKAIPTQGPCLVCHGENIAPQVQSKLKSLYPNDQATGFKLGDIRGVFVVKKDQ